jgi:F-type H+-transporting ATPase subunit epsilon
MIGAIEVEEKRECAKRQPEVNASMPMQLMNLKVLLPFQIFAEKTGVSRIVAETHRARLASCRIGSTAWRRCTGNSDLQPQRTAKFASPSMKACWSRPARVRVSVRRATGRNDLGQLREAVERGSF